jgi:hypothetical protein
MSRSNTVTRFAPSPTGGLHLGNARTALFSYLYARGAGGRFVLRLEDTDAGRSDTAHAAAIERELRWLGLAWHGDTLRQSERIPFYAEQQVIFMEELPTLPLFQRVEVTGFAPNLTGWEKGPSNYVTWNIHEWYIEGE